MVTVTEFRKLPDGYTLQEATDVRRIILSDLETYAVDTATFEVNDCFRHDEIISSRLGLLIIDGVALLASGLPLTGEKHFKYKATRERETITSDMIAKQTGIPFIPGAELVQLFPGQELIFSITLKLDTGKIHAKWRAVSTVSIQERSDGIYLGIKPVGMLPVQTIWDKAMTLYNSGHRTKSLGGDELMYFGSQTEAEDLLSLMSRFTL